MKIGNREIGGKSGDVYVIAEIGGNHDGDPEQAYRLVEAAARAGVDAVKFQHYRAETLVHSDMEAVPIARKFYKTQFERFKSLELTDEVSERLIKQCADLGIDFLTTSYDLNILERYAPHMPAIKVASGDATYYGMIRAAVATGKPVILSTGFCNMDEIKAAADMIPADRRALLHCVSIYPLPDEKVNLNGIAKLRATFPEGLIGFSDHSIGIEACLGAVALGADVLEKHFTLDTTRELGDHRLSLNPEQLATMVSGVRRLYAMRGDGRKPVSGEELLRPMLRRGTYAARDLPVGHVLREEDLLFIRPETEIGPDKAESIVGKKLAKPVAAHHAVNSTDLI
jgi:N,N'-diacetyllegionaminate synthase